MTGYSASFWRDKSVLVTGASGMVGWRLVTELIKRGAGVTCVVRDWVAGAPLLDQSLIKKINLVRGEVADLFLIERVLAEYEIDTCFHLAAQTIVGTANKSPLGTFESNIRGTWTVLEAIRRNLEVKRVVVASSDKAYGDHKVLPYTEDHPLQGKNPYDVSKSCADLITQAYAHTYKLPVCIARCGNIYGEGDLNWNRIVPGTMKSIINNESIIVRSSGLMKRDYLYVADTVAGYLLLAEQLIKKKLSGEAFNFGPNQPQTVLDIVEKIIMVSGRKNQKPVIQSRELNEIDDQFLSSQKAKKVLGWKPSTSLNMGLKKTYRWYKKFLLDKQ